MSCSQNTVQGPRSSTQDRTAADRDPCRGLRTGGRGDNIAPPRTAGWRRLDGASVTTPSNSDTRQGYQLRQSSTNVPADQPARLHPRAQKGSENRTLPHVRQDNRAGQLLCAPCHTHHHRTHHAHSQPDHHHNHHTPPPTHHPDPHPPPPTPAPPTPAPPPPPATPEPRTPRGPPGDPNTPNSTSAPPARRSQSQ